jgi:asparagine synthase (glutamine-hydrolysing)
MRAKDLPGMADVDASLLYFCRQVAQKHVVALSGECADEVFGGYPWFERPEMLHASTFPWSRDLDARREVFDPRLWKRLGVEDYVQYRYAQSVAQTPRWRGRTRKTPGGGRWPGSTSTGSCPPCWTARTA